MFWRFLSADSDDVVISRDTDSRITQREVDAINEWLKSDKDFHIMRDHPYHGIEILEGHASAHFGVQAITGMMEEYNLFPACPNGVFTVGFCYVGPGLSPACCTTAFEITSEKLSPQ